VCRAARSFNREDEQRGPVSVTQGVIRARHRARETVPEPPPRGSPGGTIPRDTVGEGATGYRTEAPVGSGHVHRPARAGGADAGG